MRRVPTFYPAGVVRSYPPPAEHVGHTRPARRRSAAGDLGPVIVGGSS